MAERHNERASSGGLVLAGYVRVSTAGQAEAFGPEVQRRAIEQWARTNGHRIARWCEDLGVSGTVQPADRPGAACVVQAIQAGDVDGVVAMTLDRIARQLHIQEAFLGVVWVHGGRVFTVDGGEVKRDDPSDPTRTLIRQVLGAVSQFERQTIVNRMSRGRRVKAEQGGYSAGAPRFGTRAQNGDLVPDPAEAAVIDRVRNMRANGLSLRAIAAELEADGVPTKRGGGWSASQVARLLDPDRRVKENAIARRRRGSPH